MKIHSIWEANTTLDKYTIVFEPELDRHGEKYYQFLGMSEGGIAVSQFGELKKPPNRYLGKKIKFEDLSEATRSHILGRIEE